MSPPAHPAPGDRSRRLRTALDLITATRPKQWVKNLLVLAAPGAAGVLTRRPVFERMGIAFASFCLVSASMYLVNDLADASSDRHDPRKRDRPIATGSVSPRLALGAGAILLAGGMAAAWPLGGRFETAIAIYAGLTIGYSLWLKEVAVLDIALVASGFVIRAIAGGLAVHVQVSQWFLILVSFGSLLVVAGKREADYTRTSPTAALASGDPDDPSSLTSIDGERVPEPNGRRPREYSVAYLRYVWMMASAVSITGYCLWAFEMPHLHAGVPWGELSVIPFVLAILRYGLLLDAGHGGTPEEIFLRDRPLQFLALAWVVIYSLGVYVGR